MAASKKDNEKHRIVSTKEVVMTLPVIKVPGFLQGFTDFVREQGVVGLAIGFVLGAQVKTLVDQLVTSFISPFLALILPGRAAAGEENSLVTRTFSLKLGDKSADFAWGAFLFQLISFMIVSLVVYLIVHRLKLDKLDKKKA